MSYTLHGLAQSGNAFKVAFMLRALGVPFCTRFVDFLRGVNRTPEWRGERNEMGEVPVLDDCPKRLMQHPVEESGYDFPKLYPAPGAWVERLRALPGWGDPCEVLPGERIAPKW